MVKKKQDEKIRITLLWGLPASGKTTYAQNLQEEAVKKQPYWNKHKANAYVHLVDIDKIGRNKKAKTPEDIRKAIVYDIEDHQHQKVSHFILDGLITTNDKAIELIQYIQEKIQFDFAGIQFEFAVVWWTKDVESCIHNDLGRRSLDSKITIENLPFEEPDRKKLYPFIENRIERQEVYRKSDAKVWAELNDLSSDMLMESSSWCLGGKSCGYDGHESINYGEPQPTAFVEFDDLLEKLCPNITLIQYKKLQNHTVSIVQHSESDYYGGHTKYAKFVCDLTKLYNFLKEMGIDLK